MINYNPIRFGTLTINDKILSIDSNSSSSFLQEEDLSGYLPLSGGEISGSLNILSGNYIQTKDGNDYINYSSRNSFLQAEDAGYGKSTLGSKGFFILSVISENSLKLSSDGISAISDYIKLEDYEFLWSVSLSNCLDSQFSQISAIDGDVVIFKNPFRTIYKVLSSLTEEQLIDIVENEIDDNAFYCPLCSNIGNAKIPTFNSNHAEGGSVHAIAQYAHAEGRHTYAEGWYSHAEGHEAVAGGTAAHAEGMCTIVLGNKGAHGEGLCALVVGTAAHAEGRETYAIGDHGSHAEGYMTSALGTYSHVEGRQTYASDRGGHAEGYQTSAIGQYSHAAGYRSSALSNYAFVWNGISAGYTQANPYHSNGEGTFNVNPKDGISGFYVNNENLADIISSHSSSAIAAMFKDDETWAALSGFAQLDSSDIESVEMSSIANALIAIAKAISKTI